MYIIIWRSGTRDAFIDTDSRGFISKFYTYDDAKENAEETFKNENENERSMWYFDYKIYKED
jgi:hypothetical protein